MLESFCKRGHNVTAIARDQHSYPCLQQHENLNWIFRDIAFAPLTFEETSFYDTVIHLAGATEGEETIRKCTFSRMR